jgi:hypothetical protein
VAKIPWLAFFFDSVDDSQPPVRTAVVEAENEDDASKLAREQIGRCLRFAIARPVWVPPSVVVLARQVASESAARRRAAPLCE